MKKAISTSAYFLSRAYEELRSITDPSYGFSPYEKNRTYKTKTVSSPEAGWIGKRKFALR